MPKRKSSNVLFDEESPRKRANLTYTNEESPTKCFPTPKRVYGRRTAIYLGSSPQKENEASRIIKEDEDKYENRDEDEDELNLIQSDRCIDSPIQSSPLTRSAKRRHILSGVEMVDSTPSTKINGIHGSSHSSKGAPRDTSHNKDDYELLPKSAGKWTLDLPQSLPLHLHPYLAAQKREILDAFQNPPFFNEQKENGSPNTNEKALQQLCDLLDGSINRGEGNSCLIVGPSGSGKTKVKE